MKSKLMTTLIFSGILGSPLAAAHGNASGRFMAFFDTNKDGVVTQEEFQSAMQARFNRIDTNHDGSVSREEFTAYLKQRREQQQLDRLKAMDENKDGHVSKSEYLAYQAKRAEKQFAKLDHNQDGELSADELNAGGRTFRHHHDGRRLFQRLDSNHDGVVSAEESRSAATAWFNKLDTNHDNKISEDELKAFRMHRQERMPKP